MQKKRQQIDTHDFPLFSYRIGNSIIHRLPTFIKIILLFALPISVFMLPLEFVAILSVICIIISTIVGFSIKEQIFAVRPILIYCLFLLIIYAIGLLFSNKSDGLYFLTLSAKLICSMQWTSLFFKTTTSLALQHTLEQVLPLSIAKTFALFLTFIPMLFGVWFKLDRSWKARGGKNNIQKIFTLLPIFISLSLHKAYNVSQTLQNRS